MSVPPRICVVLPVYNHPLTVGQVLRAAMLRFPVFVVDDGSDASTRCALGAENGFVLIRFQANRGKAAALNEGFKRAFEAGYSHAITIDADGQHRAEDLDLFGETCRRFPEALIAGQRDLAAARAPWLRRVSNALSSLCFRLETGLALADTLCGYRAYPLERMLQLRTTSTRYAFELEVLVRAFYDGWPIKRLSIQTDYTSPWARVSHFRPVRDFLSIGRAHGSLLLEAARRKSQR